MKMNRIPNTTIGFRQAAFISGLALWLSGALLSACEACNLSFARQFDSERSGTLLARDFRNALANQQGLPLSDIAGAHYFISQQAASAASGPLATPSASTVPALPMPAATMVATAGAAITPRALPEAWRSSEFIEIFERDFGLPLPPTSAVPQDTKPDKSFTVTLNEGKSYLGNGVVYEGFLTNGSIPGPTIIVDEGDIIEMIVENKGTVPHGASIHAAYTQTSKYLGKIMPGQSGRVVFQANHPGVYLYHCAPGGHAIPMHVLFGQYGMLVVKPKAHAYQLEKDLGRGPDLELFLMQHEIYASGKDAIAGDAAYVMFNGRLFRYIEEPIKVRPGDFVRIYFLNTGPNLLSTFHIVGIIWDYAYWQGHPEARWPGGQTVTAGPSDSWVVEFRIPPDEGAYTMLSHAVGSTSRGAIGLLVAEKGADTPRQVLADGQALDPAEAARTSAEATRIVSPFGIGTHPADTPVVFGPETKEVRVSIIGNSFHPKVIEIAPGTKVTWTNEDAFAYLAGEFSGIHNVAATDAPPNSDGVVGPLLAHGESFSHVFDQEWEYPYLCTPHPYMRGKVIVKKPAYSLAGIDLAVAGGGGGLWVIPALAVCFVFSITAILTRGKRPARDAD